MCDIQKNYQREDYNMAFVSSMTYTNELQFFEAVAQAKAAQSTRQTATGISLEQSNGASFQDILNNSISSQASSLAVVASVNYETNLDSYFQNAADTYGISVDLLKAVAKQESNFQTNVVSSAGAIGVMQLMPSTAEYLGVTNPYDAEQNIMGGAKLLSELSTRYNGNIDLVFAAYNAGTGAVDKYGAVPPYTETQNFVSKIKSSLGL